MRPWWRCDSGSLRKSPKPQWAYAARDDQVFWPFSTQPPRDSSRSARERSEARSDPASGSDQACAQICSPVAIDGSQRSCCSFVPFSKIVGESRKMPFWLTLPGAPAR